MAMITALNEDQQQTGPEKTMGQQQKQETGAGGDQELAARLALGDLSALGAVDEADPNAHSVNVSDDFSIFFHHRLHSNNKNRCLWPTPYAKPGPCGTPCGRTLTPCAVWPSIRSNRCCSPPAKMARWKCGTCSSRNHRVARNRRWCHPGHRPPNRRRMASRRNRRWWWRPVPPRCTIWSLAARFAVTGGLTCFHE